MPGIQDKLPRRLWANATWGAAGSIWYAGGRFAVFVLLAKHLDVEQVGAFVLALAIVTPISFLVSMGLRLVLVTDTSGAVHAGQCLALRTLSNALLLAIVLAVLLVSGQDWPRQKWVVLLLVAGVRAVENWADIYLGVLQKHERMKYVAISQLIKTATVLAGAAVVLATGGKIIAVLVVWLVVTTGVGWFYDRCRAQQLADVKLRWNFATVRQLLVLGMPLGMYVTLGSLNDGVGRYFLAAFHGDQAVGYYGGLAMVVTGLAAVQNGINQALMPRLAHKAVDEPAQFTRLLSKVLALLWVVLAALLLCVWYWGADILRLLYRPDYADHADAFVVVLAAGALLLTAMTLGDAVVAAGRFKSRMFAVALGLIVNLVLCWLWVDTHGLIGAAWSAAVSGAVVCTACIVALVARR